MQPVTPEDIEWMRRECRRFCDDTYRLVPWATDLPAIAGHFVHYSVKTPGLVAYTRSPEHGRIDRQTPIRAGRYLQKYYPDLPAEKIAEYAGQISALGKLDQVQFACTEDEIERVYTHGPSSCMSHSAASFRTDGVHPSRVYAGPDTAVAYLYGQTEDHITARAVVVKERGETKYSRWVRIYGDVSRMTQALRALGMEQGDLEGARLLKIDGPDGRYVMPYLDGGDAYVTDVGEYWEVGSHGDYEAQCTTGLIGEPEVWGECERCGEDIQTEDDGMYIESVEQTVCDGCLTEHFAYCQERSEYYERDLLCEVRQLGRSNEFVHQDCVGSGECPDTSSFAYHSCAVNDHLVYPNIAMSVVYHTEDEYWLVGRETMSGPFNLRVSTCPTSHNYYLTSLQDEKGRSPWERHEGRDEHDDQIEMSLAA